MQYQIKTRSAKIKQFVDRLMPSIVQQLNLTHSNRFVLIDVGHSAGKGNDGLCVPLPDLDSFVIALRKTRLQDIGVSLSHEMVHVKQMTRGTLRTHNGRHYWRGRLISKKIKYLDTPWEQEAFAKQELIFRKALES